VFAASFDLASLLKTACVATSRDQREQKTTVQPPRKTPCNHRNFTVKSPQKHRVFTVKTPQNHRKNTVKSRSEHGEMHGARTVNHRRNHPL